MKKQWFASFATMLAVVWNISTINATPLGEVVTRQYTGIVTGEVYPAGSQFFNEDWLETGDSFSFDISYTNVGRTGRDFYKIETSLYLNGELYWHERGSEALYFEQLDFDTNGYLQGFTYFENSNIKRADSLMNNGFSWDGSPFSGSLDFRVFDDGTMKIIERSDGRIRDESTGEYVMINGAGQDPLTYYQVTLESIIVPEPETALLFATGFAGLVGCVLRRKED